ncbi:serine carboxypeptidase-like protein 18 isoform X2 [Cinnamomum micranthum f. kanehirae]|uniref:Serine carboxypeptidase-like protein 18 isoform X2 n=1 Tax=Cinnamomum micranthum f. kanehirae TaxID=337451 RepID=A0A3S3QCB5_9MAGN|nr:serine carboxypeptidase-like protein 18 isoform X2 [Cinnamomum micranthum f. kanehirae]
MAVTKENFLSLFSQYLMLLLVCFSYCCHASSKWPVKYLPGFNGPLPFHMETGYVGVGESDEDQLFYYFVKSETNPREDPLIMWLTGGPGCSAWSGLLYEIGPLIIEYKEYNGSIPGLLLNPHSWTKIASIIFVDSPVRTGFSYSKGNKKSGDFKASKELYQFLRKWLDDHPEFLSNPLDLAGDSYSGFILPIVVQEIAKGIEAGQEPILNLKGYSLGNPFTDYRIDQNGAIPFVHGMGLISDELYESAKKNCRGDYYINSRYFLCAKDVHAIDEEYGLLLSYYYMNYYDIVRTALHIRKGTVGEWIRCNSDLHYVKEISSTIEYHLNLTTNGYRALIYSGDHDLVVPFVGTETWIRSLNFSVVDEWRSWFVGGQIAGYTRAYVNNLTFATGAGHSAPTYRPKNCFAMFERWLHSKPL